MTQNYTLALSGNGGADTADSGRGVVACRVPGTCAGMRLDLALAQMFREHSRSRLAQWLRDGSIRIDGVVAKPNRKVWGGEAVEVLARLEEEAEAKAEAMPLHIVHEDDEVLVLDKPPGLVVHPGAGRRDGTLMNALLHHAPVLSGIPRAGIVHRLDKDTSGLLVVAKTLTAQTHLVRQLQARSVFREYLALVLGAVAADGEVDAPMGRDPRNRVRMAVVGGGKTARTRYRVVERFAGATLLECRLDTGRTHQIRVHMQSIGHALIGDPVYGPKSGRAVGLPSMARQALHAARLGFVHPGSETPMASSSPLPEDFERLLDMWRAHKP